MSYRAGHEGVELPETHKIIEEETPPGQAGLTEFLFVDDSRTLSNRD
jgi:hypothetical protein